MQTIAKAPLVQCATKKKFWFGVLPANTSHHPAAGLAVNHVRHIEVSVFARIARGLDRQESREPCVRPQL